MDTWSLNLFFFSFSATPSNKDPTPPVPASNPGHKSNLQCIAVLPGLGMYEYTDSSDSDNNADSDSDEDEEPRTQLPQQPRDITGRIVKQAAAQCGGQTGCWSIMQFPVNQDNSFSEIFLGKLSVKWGWGFGMFSRNFCKYSVLSRIT